MCIATCRLYDTRDKAVIEEFVDDVLDLVELGPNRDALVSARYLLLLECIWIAAVAALKQ